MRIEDSTKKPDMSVRSIMSRLRALTPNGPKGIPSNRANEDQTNPLYPVEHNGPADRRWNPATMITGSGNGPEIGSSGTS